MIKIDGVEYRNIQEQVLKNKEDIEEIKQEGPYTKSLFIVKLNYRDEPLEDSDDAFYGTLVFLVNQDQLDDYSNLTFDSLLSVTGYIEVDGGENVGVFDFEAVDGDNTKVKLIGLGSYWVLSTSAYTHDYTTEVEIV